MKLPFYFRKNKTRFEDGKFWLDIRMNWFDQLCLIIVMIFKKKSPICGWIKDEWNGDGECIYIDANVDCDNCIINGGKQIPKGMKYER